MICNALQIIRDAYYNRGVAQFGRALRSGRRGRGFESRRLDTKRGLPYGNPLFCVENRRRLEKACGASFHDFCEANGVDPVAVVY